MCENSNILSIILFIKDIIDVIKIAVPIILILMCAIDLGKQVLNTEDKSYQRIVKRIIGAAAVFFIPTIVSLMLDIVGTTDYTGTSCWTNANTTTIKTLKKQEEADKEAKAVAIKTQQEQEQKNREAIAETRETIRKKNEELAAENTNINEVNDSTFLKENGTDGLVTVIDGVFYKPATGTSGADGTKGSGDYGYNIYFFNRLKKFVEAAAAQGYTINYSTSSYGAWRSYEIQKYYYDCYIYKNCNNGNLAAYPGKSNHGWGIASDLSYGSQAAKYWAHDNASQYGLSFPLCANIRGSCTEDWHIEPAILKTK